MELIREPEEVEVEMRIPRQPGLLFDVHVDLQHGDELFLVVANQFWVSWFPCTRRSVRESYVEAVCGVLSGAFRVFMVYSGSRYLKGYLQRPRGALWETIASSHKSFALPFTRRREVALQNVVV